MTLLPPPQYDHPPSIPVIEHVLPFDEVSNACDQLASGAFGACARVTRDAAGKITRCEIWLAKSGAFILSKERRWFFADIGEWRTYPMGRRGTVSVEFPGQARRHELAHCNGWPKDHPDAAELARRLAADRAVHHLEIEKDAAANAAADAAMRIRLKPPQTVKAEPPIVVIKVRPADDIAPVHPWPATLGPGGIFLSLCLIDGGEIKHCSQVKAPTSSEPAKSYGEFKTMAECTAESDKRNALSAQKLWGPWRWLCAPPGKLSPA